MDLYIYYRVRQDNAELLRERVLYMQQQLHMKYGVVTELKRRPEQKAGYHTWMEVYLNTPANFERALQQACDAAELGHLIVDDRHIEYFVGVSACA
jgi:hypothetical protein